MDAGVGTAHVFVGPVRPRVARARGGVRPLLRAEFASDAPGEVEGLHVGRPAAVILLVFVRLRVVALVSGAYTRSLFSST